MSDCLEVLFVSDNSGRLQTANCYDPHIGTTLMTYRGGGGAAKKCLSVIGNDYLLSADVAKPLLHIWPLNSQEPTHELRSVAPGKPSALCVSPDGFYCVAGVDGKIYVWQISSGYLLNVISRHYQAINKIVFTDDSSHFVTAGEDGLVLVWKLADVVAKQFGDVFKLTTSQIAPVYSFSQHSLPVTDLYVGRGDLKARLFTVSADQTCKIFSLSSGSLLLSLVFEHVLTSVTLNDLETQLFIGHLNGKIQVFDLDPYPRTLEHHVPQEVDGEGFFIGHTKAVTCLSISFDGSSLASGADDEKVYLWDIPSRQLLRSFEMKGPISNLFFHSVPNNLFANNFEPSLIVKKLEKMSNLEDKSFEVSVLVHKSLNPISFGNDIFMEEESFVQNVETENNPENEDVDSLKQQITKLKDINKQLYQFAMNRILKNPLSVTMNGENEQEVLESNT